MPIIILQRKAAMGKYFFLCQDYLVYRIIGKVQMINGHKFSLCMTVLSMFSYFLLSFHCKDRKLKKIYIYIYIKKAKSFLPYQIL